MWSQREYKEFLSKGISTHFQLHEETERCQVECGQVYTQNPLVDTTHLCARVYVCTTMAGVGENHPKMLFAQWFAQQQREHTQGTFH